MGSESDRPTLQPAADMLKTFGVSYEWKVISAHRTPEYLHDYIVSAEERGAQVIIGGAGGAAHLPGVIASFTTLPVLGVPVHTTHLSGLDSLLSIVQMPKGIPVGTLAIGDSGAANAAIFAVSIIALKSDAVAEKLKAYRQKQKTDLVEKSKTSEEIYRGET